MAFATTNTASASAALAWIFFDRVRGQKTSALGACVGAVVGASDWGGFGGVEVRLKADTTYPRTIVTHPYTSVRRVRLQPDDFYQRQ